MKHAAILAALFAAGLAACKREPAPAPVASVKPAASAPAPKPKPWYEGSWTGSYEAKLHRIELPAGGVREWKNDDGGAGSGRGNVNVTIDAEGRATGEAEGALGALGVNGAVDGDSVRLELAPRSGATPKDFRGVVVLARKGEALTGAIQAATGDSLTARSAPVELRRAERAP